LALGLFPEWLAQPGRAWHERNFQQRGHCVKSTTAVSLLDSANLEFGGLADDMGDGYRLFRAGNPCAGQGPAVMREGPLTSTQSYLKPLY
jgi:hypothetical protein